MAYRPMIVGADALCDWMDDFHKSAYWAVWDKRDMRFCWLNPDYDKGREVLHDNIARCEESQFGETLTLKLYPELNTKGQIDGNLFSDMSVYFSAYSLKAVGIATNSAQNQQFYREDFNSKSNKIIELLNELKPKFTEIESRLVALETDVDTEADREQGDTGIMQVISGYLKAPEGKAVVSALMGKLLGVAPAAAVGAPPAAAAPTPQASGKMAAALKVLQGNDPALADHLAIFAAMSRDNPGLYAQVTTQLKALQNG